MRKLIIFLTLMALCVAPVVATAKPVLEKPLQPLALRADLDVVEPNDDCTTANPIAVDDNYSAAIDPAGETDWFVFTAAADITVIFETHPGDIGDTKLYLFADDCTTQLAYNDDGGEGYYSLIEYDFAPGTYYVQVTGYSASYTGTYLLTAVEGVPPPPPPVNDTCDGAIDLQEQGMLQFEVTTCGAANDYNAGSGGCTGFSTNGFDVTYLINLDAGETINVTVQTTYDNAIYLVTDCADVVTSCVVGADDTVNGLESFSYTADAAGVYYLIIDGFSSIGCDVNVVTIDSPVAAQDATWSGVKGMYR